MALGRPGLEPCVLLEVRFGLVIDQQSGDAHIQAEAQCRVGFTAHYRLTEGSNRFAEPFTCFFPFFFLNKIIRPQAQRSFLTPSTLLCFKVITPLLLFAPVTTCQVGWLKFI